jgi:subtilisin family serine protease
VLALATATLVALAGTAGAAPPTPDSLRIPGAPTSLGSPASAHATALTEPTLLRRLETGAKHDFFVEFDERADLKAAFGMNWRDRGRYVFKTLRDTATRSQGRLVAELATRNVQFKPYWIANGVLVRDGDLATLERAAASAGVKRIAMLPAVRKIEPERRDAATKRAGGIAPNIARIGADRVWAQGTSGSGVTVGIIDTGVSSVHPALRRQYRGYRAGAADNDYNWLDPEIHASTPRATDEHGSHVAGTVLGDDANADPAQRERIGVAPGAQWVGCLALGTETGSPQFMLDCLEFMLAPTRTDGTQPDPDRRPDIVNNSWMSFGTCNGQGESAFANAVDAWVAAGVLPVFAAGNTSNCELPSPPGLSTVAAPASLAASFAVGSTGTNNGVYASHSLWGPTVAVSPGLPALPDPRGYPQLKPQVVAPGVAIRSSMASGGYATMTGTSMSAPHVAGAFALMIEAGECLRGDYARLGTILMQTAKGVPYDSGGSPAPGPGNVPNYATGWGEIDAYAAVQVAADACGPQGFLRGVVKGADGRPVAGAKVEISKADGTPVHTLTTDVDGSYVRRVPEVLSGGYALRVSAYGFLADDESGLLVKDGGTTQHDVTLATAPMHKITGRVTDAQTGWPLHARLTIAGYPGDPVWTDPATGVYAVRLPEGTAYRFDLTSAIAGYGTASRDVADAAVATQDFTLAADRVTCDAPGYRHTQTFIDENFEHAGGQPPTGWTAASNGIGWRFGTTDDISGPIFYIPAHGRFAATNEEHGDNQGWTNDGSAEYLTLPPLALAGAVEPTLSFAYVFPQGFLSSASVQGSVDGGATWQSLAAIAPHEQWPVWTRTNVSLAPLAGAASARVRFHINDGTDAANPEILGSVFALDDVAAKGNCVAPAQGGLVVGRVRDANTGVALDGAMVTVGNVTTTSATSADPAVGAGFYALYAAPGAATVTATRGSLPDGYGNGSASASVVTRETVVADVTLPAGRLRLYPTAGPSANVTLGTSANVALTVTNSGTLPLAYAFERVASEQHFEGAFPPAGWSVTHDGTSSCTWRALDPNRFGNYAGGDGRAAMVYGYDCFGAPSETDTSLVSPLFDLSTSQTASLGFFLSFAIGGDLPRLDIDVSRDGGTTWTTAHTQTELASPGGPGTLVEIDLTPHVGSATTRLRLRYRSTPPNSYVIVDQLHVFDGVSMHEWVDLAPARGTLAAGATQTLNATLDATRITQPGTYQVPIRVAENTPYEWPFDGQFNATLRVTAPASYGSVGGVVRGLGACDAVPATLPGATVRIRNARGDVFETTTDADGRWQYWASPADGPFMLSAQATDHRDADARQVTLAAGSQTAADIDLRVRLACLTTDPGSLVASAAPGAGTTLPFSLVNLGAATTLWSARTGGDPAERVPVPQAQTNRTDVEMNMWTGCGNNGATLENHYMRRYVLREVMPGALTVEVPGIEFAIDTATSAKGQQTATARLYALRGDGTMKFANLQLLREKTLTIADTTNGRVRVTFDTPVTLARDETVVVSVYSPDAGNLFALGFNTFGQSAPSYMASPQCETLEPTPLGEIDPRLGHVAMLMELTVLDSAPCHARATPVTWASFTPAGGTLAADATAQATAQIATTGLTNGSHAGSLCLTSNGEAPIAVPVRLNIGVDAIFRDGFE